MDVRLYADIMRQHHTLIAGTTGAGKSVVLNGLLYIAMCNPPEAAQLVLIDPKRVELSIYKRLPHCLTYAETPAQALDALRTASRILDRRLDEMKRRGLTQYDGGGVYVIVDELADLVLNATYKCDILDLLQHIGTLGRAAGVHLIAATQAPSRQTLPARLAVNFTAQLALRCRSAIESRQIIQQTGAELLPEHGRGIYYTPKLMRAGYVNIEMIPRDTLADMAASWARGIRPQPLP